MALLRRWPRTVTVFASILAIAAFLLLLEGSYRGLRYLVKGPNPYDASGTADPDLGWALNTDRGSLDHANACGERVTIPPYEDRYLRRSSRQTNGIPLLFIGDSYTDALEVSAGQAYYDVFEERHDGTYAVHAAGVGAFGSVQEYLLLKKIYERMKPRVVMWQLCANDPENNVYELAYRYPNTLRPRPFLDPSNGAITMRRPGLSLLGHSKGFGFLFSRFYELDYRYQLGLLDRINAALGPSDAEIDVLMQDGFNVLRWVLMRAIEDYPDTRFIGFSACWRPNSPQHVNTELAFERIFTESGAEFIPRLAARVFTEGATDCLPKNGHWNHRGHRVAAEFLTEYLTTPGPAPSD